MAGLSPRKFFFKPIRRLKPIERPAEEAKKDHENAIIRAVESDGKIKSLHEENYKMAAEIESLKATVTDLVNDNESIKNILDIKQNEWTKIAEKQSSPTANPPETTTKMPATKLILQNRFDMLNDESGENISSPELDSTEQKSENINSQINNYRTKERSKFENKKKAQTHNQKGKKKTGDETQKEKNNKVLVIGDSMVKHIDRQKIERAAGCQSVVHSYSGARVEQINSKIKEYWSEGEQYDTVVLHVGTNNLVSEDPEKVAAKMDELIENLKDHAKKIAVSSVIKRYDNRVPASNITYFNNLVNNLCSNRNITFLNNDHIDRSFLNRSNLHLNQLGDRVLGSAYCTYLKSARVRPTGNIQKPVGNDKQFFRQAYGHRNREWTMYLQYVNQALNH